MLKFEGDRRFARPVAEVYAKLADARFLAPCVPDVSETRQLNEADAELVLRPGFAFIRGTLDLKMQRTEADEGARRVRWLLASKGIGSTADVEATLELSEAEGGTAAHWVAEVKELTGLLKWVPGGLISGAAQSVINNAWDRVEKAL